MGEAKGLRERRVWMRGPGPVKFEGGLDRATV